MRADAGAVAFAVREVHDLVHCQREARRPALDERKAAEHVVGCDARHGISSAATTEPGDRSLEILFRRHLEAEQALLDSRRRAELRRAQLLERPCKRRQIVTRDEQLVRCVQMRALALGQPDVRPVAQPRLPVTPNRVARLRRLSLTWHPGQIVCIYLRVWRSPLSR